MAVGGTTRWALGGLLGPAAFIGAWVTGTLVTDADYSPVDDPISRLAAVDAPTQPLMTAGFVGFGLGVSAFAVALRRRVPGPAWIAAATSAAATVLVAATPLDRSDAVDQLHGLFAGVGYVALTLTPVLAAPHLVRAGRRGLGLAGFGAGAVSAGALVLSLAGPPSGLFQRLGLTSGDLWIMAAAVSMLLGHRWPSDALSRPGGRVSVWSGSGVGTTGP